MESRSSTTIRDVARLAEVSVGTVSNVLNHRSGTVSAQTKDRVHQAIEHLGYRRNDTARRLRAGTSSTVGFVVLDGQNPFFSDVVRGAEDEASRDGIAVLLGNTDNDQSREQMYLDLFEEQGVRGILLSPYLDIHSRLEQLLERNILAVLVDRWSGDERFSSVSVDNVAGGRMAAAHLIAQGRRRLAFVGGPLGLRQVTDRLAGASVAVEQSNSPASLEVVATRALTVDEGARAGARLLARRGHDRPDGIFAANDLVGLGLLQALGGRGENLVPESIAVVGFDDIPFARAAAVPLSSIRQPGKQMGAMAMRMLLDQSANPDTAPRQVVFNPELIARESSGIAAVR
jgi:LacI family transcriptional regulator